MPQRNSRTFFDLYIYTIQLHISDNDNDNDNDNFPPMALTGQKCFSMVIATAMEITITMEALNRHLFILKISFSYLRPFSVAFFFDAKDFPSFDIKEFLDQHSGIINLNRPHRVDRCRTFLVFPFLDSSALPLTKNIPML